ncbi:hypothetical protein H3143_01975 [Mycoplasma tullyi]|uniref:Uncharacterized protein n=1 Tax=Mycoplasma tullyi TaxID=1612150 RepID=A0A7D7Y5H9_9MOLU|nr:hypothetical protein [Mycoplasma tullyi]QMT98256.1 hypothetical protein H3143_01975 [Mycoplasma tullyi]
MNKEVETENAPKKKLALDNYYSDQIEEDKKAHHQLLDDEKFDYTYDYYLVYMSLLENALVKRLENKKNKTVESKPVKEAENSAKSSEAEEKVEDQEVNSKEEAEDSETENQVIVQEANSKEEIEASEKNSEDQENDSEDDLEVNASGSEEQAEDQANGSENEVEASENDSEGQVEVSAPLSEDQVVISAPQYEDEVEASTADSQIQEVESKEEQDHVVEDQIVEDNMDQQTNNDSNQNDIVDEEEQEEQSDVLVDSEQVQKDQLQDEENLEDLETENKVEDQNIDSKEEVSTSSTNVENSKDESNVQDQKTESNALVSNVEPKPQDPKVASKSKQQSTTNDIHALDERAALSIKKLLDPSTISLLPIPSAFSNYTNNNDQQTEDNKYHLSFADVSVDPINNFYQKVVDSVDPLLDDYIKLIINENHQPLKQQQVLVDESKIIETNIKNLYKTQKILGRKVANVFIIISCFLIFGLALIPILLKNKKIINEYDAYENQRKNELEQIWTTSHGLSLQFASRLNFNEMIKFIANKLNLGYGNYCSQETYQFISSCMNDFTVLHSAANFKYKNTEITDCVATYEEIRPIVTSNAVRFPYRDIETYTTSDGAIRTRTVTKYETLVAYHEEPTPFLEDRHFQILKTNFKPGFSFTTNVKTKTDKTKIKNFINFENKEFSKKLRITNDDNQINTELLEFFTIKAQEDYLKWADELNHKFNLTKTGRFLINDYVDVDYELDGLTTLPKKVKKNTVVSPLTQYSSWDINVAYNINEFNLKHLVAYQKQTVDQLVDIFKMVAKYYLYDFAEQVTPFLLSPAINREWYSSDGNYKIANSGNFEDHISSKDKPSNSYLLAKVYYEGLINFNQYDQAKKAWFEINRLDRDNQFLRYDLAHKSYGAQEEVDLVLVTGVHVGTQTIPVPYTRYYPIEEDKTVFYLAKDRTNKNNFIISKKKSNGFFELAHKANIPISNLDKINLHPNTSIEMQNPYQVLLDPNQVAYLDILNQLQNNCTDKIHVQANDDGYFIFVNSTQANDLALPEFFNSIKKLKNNLLELNQLEN